MEKPNHWLKWQPIMGLSWQAYTRGALFPRAKIKAVAYDES